VSEEYAIYVVLDTCPRAAGENPCYALWQLLDDKPKVDTVQIQFQSLKEVGRSMSTSVPAYTGAPPKGGVPTTTIPLWGADLVPGDIGTEKRSGGAVSTYAASSPSGLSTAIVWTIVQTARSRPRAMTAPEQLAAVCGLSRKVATPPSYGLSDLVD
jgi:hypothetical protein